MEFEYKFGTMIEIPRAALTAGEIADVAEFFSFGTNDLTQMTFGYSRDDAERNFLVTYVEEGILPTNPFQSVDHGWCWALDGDVGGGRRAVHAQIWKLVFAVNMAVILLQLISAIRSARTM